MLSLKVRRPFDQYPRSSSNSLASVGRATDTQDPRQEEHMQSTTQKVKVSFLIKYEYTWLPIRNGLTKAATKILIPRKG